MKQIFGTDNGFVIIENGKTIAEFDRNEVIDYLLAQQQLKREEIGQQLQLCEDRANGFGWEYNIKAEGN